MDIESKRTTQPFIDGVCSSDGQGIEACNIGKIRPDPRWADRAYPIREQNKQIHYPQIDKERQLDPPQIDSTK